MKKILIVIPLFLIAAEGFAAGQRAYVARSQNIPERAYQVNVLGSFWQTTSHYDHSGNEVALEEGEDFTKIDGEIAVRYGYSQRIEWRVGGRYRQNSGIANSSARELRSAGFESGEIGFKYAFARTGRAEYAVDLFTRIGTYENKTPATGSEIVLGDEGQEVGAGLFLSYYTSATHLISTQVHFVAPGNDLSQEVRWRAETAWRGRQWAAAIGVKGINALGNDPYGDSVSEKPTQDTPGTQLFNSINREVLSPFAAIYFAQKSWRVGFTYAQVMAGSSTDAGAESMITFTWTSKGKSMDREIEGNFKEYNVEASVVKVSPRSSFVKLDKGSANDIEKGMRFDIYKTNYFGGNILIASGVVFKVLVESAIIKILKIYKKIKIENGFVARGH